MKLGDLQEASSDRAFEQPQIKDLIAAVAGFLRATTIHQSPTGPCIDAETVDRIKTLTGMTMTLPVCPTHFDEDGDQGSDVKVSTSGSVNFSRANDDFTLILDDFELLTTHMADGSVLKEVLNLTGTGTVERTTVCREKEIPDSVTAKINGTFSRKIDENADGVWDEDTQGHFENFALGVTVRYFDPSSCVPTNFAVSESGMFAFRDNLKASDTFTVAIWQNAPVILTWETVDDSVQVMVHGSFTLISSCLTGSLTLTTTEALALPILEADRDLVDCPTSGVISITGDESTTVTFTSSGGIEIDSDGDGLLDERFENCHDAQFCL
jgi:hypothetical protein